MTKATTPGRATPPARDVRRYFESRLRKFGDSPKSLDWSEQGQRIRFEILSQVADLEGRQVLDVGCGLGHFYDFLRARFRRLRYTGIDFAPSMIAAAQRRCPRAKFLVHDGTSGHLPVKADFVFASGVLNVENGRNEAGMRRLLRGCFEGARHAAAVNMLSTWADWYDRDRHYYDPIQMVRAAHGMSKRVVLRHDYMPHDFTLFLYRTP